MKHLTDSQILIAIECHPPGYARHVLEKEMARRHAAARAAWHSWTVLPGGGVALNLARPMADAANPFTLN